MNCGGRHRGVRVRRRVAFWAVLVRDAPGSAASSLQVFAQQGHAGERLAATSTRVFLDVRVSLEMCPQVGSVGEGTSAVMAREWFLAGVGTDVSLQ